MRLTLRSFAAFCGILLVPYLARQTGMTHSCEFEDFSGQVLEDGGHVNCSLGSNSHLVLGVVLEETLDTTAGELELQVSIRANAGMYRE